MTVNGRQLYVATSGTTLVVGHDFTVGLRSVLVVITPAATTITSILTDPGGAPGGWTARDTHTAQGRRISLFDKINAPGDGGSHTVTFTPAAHFTTARIYAFTATFVAEGPAIRAASFADVATGDTLTLPSLTVPTGEDLWAVTWNARLAPATAVQRFPQAPLSTTGNAIQTGENFATEAYESWQSSSPTGPRYFTCTPGAGVAPGLAVLMVVGSTIPLGGWGVGQVRMGAN